MNNIRYLLDLIFILTKKETKIRYKNSYFGYLWSLANPICFSIIYYTVFKLVMRVPIENYTIFLLSTLFVWQWVASSISTNLFVYISNAQLIKKVNFPKYTLPLSNILMELFNFCMTLPVLFSLCLFYGINLTLIHFVGTLILLIIQVVFIYGVSLCISSINLFFRDTERFVQLGLLMLFYATPILYSVELVPDNYKWLIYINPFSYLIISWRELILNGVLMWNYIGILIVICIAFMLLGIMSYEKCKHKFAEVL